MSNNANPEMNVVARILYAICLTAITMTALICFGCEPAPSINHYHYAQ